MTADDSQQSLVKTLGKLFSSFALVVGEIVEIATLELRLAGKSLLLIIWLVCATGILLLLAWIFILAAAAAALVIYAKLNWFVALLAVAILNLILIMPVLLLIVKFKNYLSFPATRRQLQAYGGAHENPQIIEKNSTK